MERPPRNIHSLMNVKFESELREEQKKVKKEAIDILNQFGSVIISAACGFGKTITSINICCSIKLKTLIVVNKIVLMTQWKDSILKFCPLSKVQLIKPNTVFDKDCDFFIVNAINIPKMGRRYFHLIQCCVLDEVHLLMAEKLSNLTAYIQPRYLIGLSATPYRLDGLNILLDLFFGPDKIVRDLLHHHILYPIKTGFKPKIELAANGTVNWSALLESQSSDVKRNDLILRLIHYFADRVFLVLVKRVEQGRYLEEKLKESGCAVTSLLGTNQDFDKTARVLIGTTQKVGVGFDHSKLDALLLACDIQDYYIQYMARVFRRPDVVPFVFDLLDDNPILKRHYKTREKVSLEHGGEMKDFTRDFPSF